MRTIVRMRYGSHLFGTATPASDFDVKSVHVPDARDILLGRAKGSLSIRRAKPEGEKNLPGETEEESYSLQKFLGLLAEGQTVALDMLFAPPDAMLEPPTPEWGKIVTNRHRLLTRKSAAFVGYCRQQANKYGVKGARVASARQVLEALNEAVVAGHGREKLAVLDASCRALAALQHVTIVPIRQLGGTVIEHLDVCGRKLSYTASIRHGRDVIAKLVEEYGHRALQAESQEGVDWKALSHAVRIGSEAVELLRTGRITLPLPNAAHVLAVKLGQVAYEAVSAEIEALLADVEAAAEASALPAEPDAGWIEDFVAGVYAGEAQSVRGPPG